MNNLERLPDIDRTETIERVYYLRDGALALEDEHWDVPRWGSERLEHFASTLGALLDRGGTVWGAFDGPVLVGIAALDARFIGSGRDRLNMQLLHVSHGYRRRGIGTRLVELTKERARELGARALYVSASPSESTVRFYTGRGCALASEVDPELFELEPEDIHMELSLD